MPVTALDPKAEAGRKPTVWSPSSLSFTVPAATVEWVSVALGGMLFALIGIAFAWSLGYIVIAAVGFAACTWLAESLSRALICLFASLGLLAAVLALVSRFAPELFTTLSLDWLVLFILWWALALVAAAAFRRSELESDYGLAEIIGISISVFIALFISLKLDFHSNLLYYLLHVEDNAAWVSLTTGISANDSVVPSFGGNLGPLIPLLLGLLHTAQESSVPAQTATFAAYALAIVLTPMVAASLLRQLSGLPRIAVIAFAVVLAAWAFGVPLNLFGSFGHLSATWVFLGLIVLTSFIMFDRRSSWSLPVGLSLTAFVGATWFPVSPLAGFIAIALCIPLARKSNTLTRVVLAIALAAGVVLLSVQPESLGLTPGSAGGLKGLFAASGGTAAIDPTLLVLVLGGTIALSALATRQRPVQVGLSTMLMGLIAYLAVVYSLSYALQSSRDYGVTKMTYILAWVAVLALIAVVPRFRMPQRPLTAIIVALALGSLIYGGGGSLVSRTWPGELSKPAWVAPVDAALASQGTAQPRPIACFSATPMDLYMCTRWAGALTAAGDGDFLNYRLGVLAGADMNLLVRDLRKSGVLARSDVIFLSPAGLAIPWSEDLLNSAGQAFGPGGEELARKNARRGQRRASH
ncbi:MAG: hypothetical protein WCK06_10385 [Actinomycetota bacterium]